MTQQVTLGSKWPLTQALWRCRGGGGGGKKKNPADYLGKKKKEFYGKCNSLLKSGWFGHGYIMFCKTTTIAFIIISLHNIYLFFCWEAKWGRWVADFQKRLKQYLLKRTYEACEADLEMMGPSSSYHNIKKRFPNKNKNVTFSWFTSTNFGLKWYTKTVRIL